ncbi:MAG: GspH/FimT family pseudopilin [Sedimenticola sp.]
MKKKTTGFTLVELMVTLSVAGILLAIAVPSYTAMVENNRLATAANSFISSMGLARSEALKLRADITVAVADNSTATNEWGKEGWAIAGGGTPNWTADDGWEATQPSGVTVLKQIPKLSSAITLNSAGNYSEFTYSADGSVDQLDTLDLCAGSGEPVRQISVERTGRVSFSVSESDTCP